MAYGDQKFDLARLMREHHITIRELAGRMDVTLKAVRKVRAAKTVDYLTYCDYSQGTTGINVFNLAYYNTMPRSWGG